MKKTKNVLAKIWISIGILILAWTAFWYIKVRILNQYGLITNVILLTVGYLLILNYILITAVYFAIKRLKKKHKI